MAVVFGFFFLLLLLLDNADLAVLTFTLLFDSLKFKEMKGHTPFGDHLKIICTQRANTIVAVSPPELLPTCPTGQAFSLLFDI